MEMDDLTSVPKKLPVFSLLQSQEKVEWINNMSQQIIDSFMLFEMNSVEQVRDNLTALNIEDQQLQRMKVDGEYACALCHKRYSSLSWFRKHLEKSHAWKFHIVNVNADSTNPVQVFLFMALLFRDLCDAYKMGDGERIVRNAYFEWLYDAAQKHTKYKLWLWRMISYTFSIIGYNKSFEYKWNMSVNLKGGIANSIPNDNGVELQINNIKRQLNTHGANKSYQSARKVCLTTQVIDSIKDQLIKTTKASRSKRDRPALDKTKDIALMIKLLRTSGSVKDIHWKSFAKFIDPLQRLKIPDLHNWINNQKKISSVYL